MNHKITQIFVPSAVDAAAASTFALANKSIAAFDADGNSNLGATPAVPASFKLVLELVLTTNLVLSKLALSSKAIFCL